VVAIAITSVVEAFTLPEAAVRRIGAAAEPASG
jgi:hypothetical protein